MSSRPLKFCSYRGCKTKHNNTNGYCLEHKPKSKQQRTIKESSKVYNTNEWRAYSKRFRTCAQVCTYFDTCGGLAQCVDHIKPVELGGSFWDTHNHQALCNTCHARKSASEGNLRLRTKMR